MRRLVSGCVFRWGENSFWLTASVSRHAGCAPGAGSAPLPARVPPHARAAAGQEHLRGKGPSPAAATDDRNPPTQPRRARLSAGASSQHSGAPSHFSVPYHSPQDDIASAGRSQAAGACWDDARIRKVVILLFDGRAIGPAFALSFSRHPRGMCCPPACAAPRAPPLNGVRGKRYERRTLLCDPNSSNG